MDPEVWKRVKAAIVAFEELPENKQAAFLKRIKADDPPCYEELLPLLEVDEASMGFLAQPLFQLSDEIEESTPFSVGEMLGPYRLVKRLGSGGMGTVYMAQTEGDEGGPPVAVKVLKRGLDADELRHRFHKERRILAYLNHPNIAKLQDYGTTHDGRPYLVMEFVEGEHITTYCDRHRLSIRERLKIFQRICAAVQYAHQNLIIHRDLKPANILVTPYGEPKLLDFGIAKLMDPEGTKTPVTQTLLNLRPMTPDYASPEQVRGAATDTTCDIYALGVVLYELLTGRRPYRLQGISDEERTRIICEVIPDKPSVVVTQAQKDRDDDFFQDPVKVAEARGSEPKRLSRRLRGDVDTIVAKALRKERSRRYASAEQFSADIERHMQGFPLRARPESSVYATKKFIRRHGVLVSGVIGILLVLLGFSAVVSRQNLRLKQQRDMTEREGERVSHMLDFFQDMLELASSAQHGGETAYLRQALAQIRERTADVQLSEAELAARKQAFGMGYASIGQTEEAQALLEEALALHRRAFPEESRALTFSMLTLARFYLKTSQYGKAQAQLREARGLLANQGDLATWEMAEVIGLLAQAHDGLGDFETAALQYAETFAMLEPYKDSRFTLWTEMQKAHGDHFFKRGMGEKARNLYQEIFQEKQQRRGPQDLSLVPILRSLADLAMVHGHAELALNNLDRADQIANAVPGEALELKGLLEQRAQVYEGQGAWDHVEATARQALLLNRISKVKALTWRQKLAQALTQQSRYLEAECYLRDAWAFLPKEISGDHVALGLQLAHVLNLKDEREEAQEVLADAERMDLSLPSDQQIHRAAILREQALQALAENRLPEAQSAIEEAMALQNDEKPEQKVSQAWNAWVAAQVYQRSRQWDKAKAAIAKCLALRLEIYQSTSHWYVREAELFAENIDAMSRRGP